MKYINLLLYIIKNNFLSKYQISIISVKYYLFSKLKICY